VLTIPEAIETVSGDSELDTNVAVDGEGNIYALGSFNYAVFKFNREGKFLNRFGSQGDEKGQFRSPYAIAVDGQGRVFVSDVNGILVFDSDGRYLKQFDAPGAIFGMVFNDTGELLVTSSNQKVYKYTIK
jgi:outer membrane protein assembly factor BamB